VFEILAVNAFKLLTIFLVAFTGGLCVKYGLSRVNYTRKINHFCLFFVPTLIDKFFVYADPGTFWLSEGMFFLGSFIIFIKPVRDRVSIIATAFSSFDRPEDRPYTLIWFIMQEFAGYLVFMPALEIYQKYNMLGLLAIPILISTFGDGLAEPIGVRFGKYHYFTYAIFAKRKYIRTLEGSLAVFVSNMLVTCFFCTFFTHAQFIAALIVMPFTMTLAEAFSPHTLDNPLITLVGFTNIFLIKQFV